MPSLLTSPIPATSVPAAPLAPIWGPSQLMAFSGLDGPTDFLGQLVLHTGGQPGQFQLRLPFAAVIDLGIAAPIETTQLTGDRWEALGPAGPLQMAFLDSRTLIGAWPERGQLVIDGRPLSGGLHPIEPADADTAVFRHLHPAGQRLFAAVSGSRWALFSLPEEAIDTAGAVAERAFAADLSETFAERGAWREGLTLPDEALIPADRRLLDKALSVMKVNLLSAAGRIQRLWSTPDRWPHRDMWLWDSGFHAVGMAHVDPAAAQQILLAMLEQIGEDGFLPLKASPFQPHPEVTQPPILAWAAEKVFARSGDVAWLRTCLPLLSAYLDWNRAHRDRNGNGLLEWAIDGSPLCRSGESGMDNSPRFDQAVALDAVDFSAMLAAEETALACLAEAVGQTALAEAARGRARDLGERIENLLWNDPVQFYCDRTMEGSFSPVLAMSGFLPLLTDTIAPHRVAALAGHLRNPATFGAPLPVPSVALNEGTFCKDMWRGPVWLNYNVLIAEGFIRHGYVEEARHIRTRTLEAVREAYETGGCLYEYYDALDVTPPSRLDRKQRLVNGDLPPITDFHWTAAMTVHLLLSGER